MHKWRAAMQLVGMGWYIGICVVLGVFGGLWVDSRLKTSPLLAIAGLILGVIVAVYGVYRMLLPMLERKQNKKEND
jgi:F0F1-type ATP synthase assembly protein I